ncbi:MAG: hypothetical protein SVU69_00625 [Pseudomonadota bacterium]|nr:hypothetical protein [Pseudomonadota bacterium]
MKQRRLLNWIVLGLCLLMAAPGTSWAQSKGKILILMAEQNVQGEYLAWWTGHTRTEVDLSVVEGVLAQGLTEAGFDVIDPSVLEELRVEKAYKTVSLGVDEAVSVAQNYGADMVLFGQAVAKATPSQIAGTRMMSAFANISAKLVRISDRKVLGYFSASGDALHIDSLTGGREALEEGGQQLLAKFLEKTAPRAAPGP